MSFNFDTEQATAPWLSEILTRNGYLYSGQVTHVDQTTAAVNTGASASMYSLRLAYSANSTGAKPSKCLMKLTKPAAGHSFDERAERYAAWLLLPPSHRYTTLQKEAVFYESLRNPSTTLPIPRCYGSVVDAANHQSCLLLEDFSDTHTQPPWPIPPDQQQCERTVLALAQLHAHWWDNARFGNSDFPLVSPKQCVEIVSVFEAAYQDFRDQLGDRLSDSRRTVYQRTLASLPRLLKSRLVDSSQLTLVHGDAHHWNTLLPTSGEQLVIIDWQTWHVDVATHDLAYLMGVLWYPEHRARQEQCLLALYQRAIHSFGLDYSERDLLQDYRLSILRHLFTPVILSEFTPAAVWWPQLDRVFSAFENWQCAELLDEPTTNDSNNQ